MDRLRTQQEDMEAYLSGRLPYSKVKAFEKRLTQDEDLRKDFESYRKTRAHRQAIAIESYRRQIEEKKTVVSEQVEQLELAEPGAQVIPLYRRLRPYIAAAAAIALIAIFAFPFLFDIPDGGSQIPTAPIAMALHFADEYDQAKVSMDVRKGGDDQDSTSYQARKDLALQWYNQSEPAYASIVDSLSGIPQESREDWVEYILGQSLFETKDYERAAASFEKLSGKGAYGRRADAYLLLSYLAQEKQESPEFQTILKKIIDEGEVHSFYDEALAIQETLQK